MEIVAIILLIIFNGTLSLSEMALISSRKSRLDADVKKGSRSAQIVLDTKENPNKFLSTIQIYNTLSSILIGLLTGETFAESLAGLIGMQEVLMPYAMTIAKVITVAVSTYLILLFGELVPKRVGMAYAEKISKTIIRPMLFLAFLSTPLVWLLASSISIVLKILNIKTNVENKVTEDDIKAIVKEGVDDGEVQEDEHEMVERVFSLDTRDVASIMTHRNDIIWLDTKESPLENAKIISENPHQVYPVAEEELKNLKGVVYLKDMFNSLNNPDFSLDSFITPANLLPETQTVLGALENFKKNHCDDGMIIDEFGDVVGMITIRDILEALVGEIETENDDEKPVQREDGTWLFDGQYSFYSFLEQFDMESLYAEHDYNTLSGLLLELFEHIPQTGEQTEWHEIHFEVKDMDGARIDKVLVTPLNSKDEEE